MALAAQVEQAECQLDAVIARLVLPIGRILALEPGEVLDLPQAALDAITLEARDGRRIARSRLGQNRGMRALKISLAESAGRVAPVPVPVPVPAEVAPVAAPPVEDLRAAS
jgi:flagellar motor switch protein FliM